MRLIDRSGKHYLIFKAKASKPIPIILKQLKSIQKKVGFCLRKGFVVERGYCGDDFANDIFTHKIRVDLWKS